MENLLLRFICTGDRTVTSLALGWPLHTGRLSVCAQRSHSFPRCGPHTMLATTTDQILSVGVLSGERSFDLE